MGAWMEMTGGGYSGAEELFGHPAELSYARTCETLLGFPYDVTAYPTPPRVAG